MGPLLQPFLGFEPGFPWANEPSPTSFPEVAQKAWHLSEMACPSASGGNAQEYALVYDPRNRLGLGGKSQPGKSRSNQPGVPIQADAGHSHGCERTGDVSPPSAWR